MFLVDRLILVCSVLLVIGIVVVLNRMNLAVVIAPASARAAMDTAFSDQSRRS